MIQQVQNSCQFHGLPGDDANKHLDKFLHVTQCIKVNGVTDDALHLYLFPHSLTHHATTWFDRLPRNSINIFEQMAKMFLEKYFPPSMVTKLRNEIINFRQLPDESLFEAWESYKLSIHRCLNQNMFPVTQIDTFYNWLTLRHHDTINAAAGGTFMKRRLEECYDLIKNMTAHHNDWDTSAQWTTVGQTQNVYASGAYQGGNSYQPQGTSHDQNPPPAYQALAYQASGYQASVHQHPIPQPQVVTTTEFTNYMKENDAILKNMQTNMTSLTNSNLEHTNMIGQFMKMNTASSSGLGTLPSNTVTNPEDDLKGITTRSRNPYQGPTIPTTSSSLLKVVERETDVTKDMMPPTNNGSTKDEYSQEVLGFSDVIASGNPTPYYEPFVSTSFPTLTPFGDSDFLLEEVDAFLALEDGPTSPEVDHSYHDTEEDILLLKAFLNNDPSLPPPTQGITPLNEHCSAVLLKILPEKLGDLDKFLIPCDFSRMDEFLALTDLGASINLMQLSVWNKLSLPELSHTCMTFELANRSISCLVWVSEDVFVKVETFHFPTDFVVVDFDVDPRVPLILGRSFLKTGRALIDGYEGELALCVGKEAVTFNLDRTSRYSANYDAMSVNRIDLIDVAYEEYSQEVLGFSMSGNPTPSTKPIVSNSSPTPTPFGDSFF
nr:reverse transcriptase domain-containing protein [Tanacetum cinerariifolium]